MKEVIKYVASDGTEFDNKDTCEEYEQELENTPLMWDCYGNSTTDIDNDDIEFVYAATPGEVKMYNRHFSDPEDQIEEGLNYLATESVSPYGNVLVSLDTGDIKNIVKIAKEIGWLKEDT